MSRRKEKSSQEIDSFSLWYHFGKAVRTPATFATLTRTGALHYPHWVGARTGGGDHCRIGFGSQQTQRIASGLLEWGCGGGARGQPNCFTGSQTRITLACRGTNRRNFRGKTHSWYEIHFTHHNHTCPCARRLLTMLGNGNSIDRAPCRARERMAGALAGCSCPEVRRLNVGCSLGC